MNCKICNNATSVLFKEKILFKYDIGYYRCDTCGFVQTEEPYWLDEAYANALNLSDTGLLYRNGKLFQKTFTILRSTFPKDAKFVDYGAGFGIFVRTMRDAGLDFYWQDKYAKNLCARGFEYDPNQKYDALTTFEVFEHLVNPMQEIEEMFKLSDTIIFSTEMIADTPPKFNDWWYYQPNHGQHIAFYSKKSLLYIANKFNATLYTDGHGFHTISKKKITMYNLLLKLSKIGLPNLLKKTVKTKYFSDHLLLMDKH